MKLGSTNVSFSHLRNERITTCSLAVKGVIYHGLAKCSNNDNFCRNTGRKVALTKALEAASDALTKRQRKNVWEAYRTMTQIPRW